MDLQIIQNKIFQIRGYKVMLDFHLAELYQVETRALKQAVKRNMNRFPPDFAFSLEKEEWKERVCRNARCTFFFSLAIK
ncbi:ORF6N domain-containing protein, partial [Butyricimonas virosa]